MDLQCIYAQACSPIELWLSCCSAAEWDHPAVGDQWRPLWRAVGGLGQQPAHRQPPTDTEQVVPLHAAYAGSALLTCSDCSVLACQHIGMHCPCFLHSPAWLCGLHQHACQPTQAPVQPRPSTGLTIPDSGLAVQPVQSVQLQRGQQLGRLRRHCHRRQRQHKPVFLCPGSLPCACCSISDPCSCSCGAISSCSGCCPSPWWRRWQQCRSRCR